MKRKLFYLAIFDDDADGGYILFKDEEELITKLQKTIDAYIGEDKEQVIRFKISLKEYD